MSRRLSLLAVVLAGTALLTGAAVAGPVNVALYDSFSENSGVGITFGNYAGSITANDIMFYTDNSGGWFPTQVGGFGAAFGANITSDLSVATTGTYNFSVGSDDADYVFIDGTLVGSEPGAHGYFTTPFSVFLTAGTHTLDVEFYNGPCCGSGVDLSLPATGVSYVAAVPEPVSMAVLGVGLFGLGVARRRNA